MNEISIFQKCKAKIPEFVKINDKTGVISFPIKKDYLCIRFSVEEIEKGNFFVWWEFFKGNIPFNKKRRGLSIIAQEKFTPSKKYTMYDCGSKINKEGFSFGVVYKRN